MKYEYECNSVFKSQYLVNQIFLFDWFLLKMTVRVVVEVMFHCSASTPRESNTQL